MYLQEPMLPSKPFISNCVWVGNPKPYPKLYTAVFPQLAGGKGERKKEEKKLKEKDAILLHFQYCENC